MTAIEDKRLPHDAFDDEKMLALMEAFADGVLLCDSELNLIGINSAGLNFFPYETRKADIIGKRLSDILPGLKETVSFDTLMDVVKTGETFVDKNIVPHPVSGDRCLTISAAKIGDGLGIIITNQTGNRCFEKELNRQKALFISQTEKSHAEISETNRLLKEEIEKHHQTNKKLREIEQRNRMFVESSLQGVLILQEGRFAFANEAFAKILGYTLEETVSLSEDDIMAMIYYEDRPTVLRRIQDRLQGKPVPTHFEQRMVRKDGSIRWIETFAKKADYMGKPAIQAFFIDITDRKNLEIKRGRYHEQLEELVKKRTANLAMANTALKVLLKKGKEDNVEIEKKILINVKKIITPYIEKLRKSNITATQKNYLDILESNLNNITSPFIRGITTDGFLFTRQETQVANMIRAGKTAREIAGLMGLSIRTIEAYRYGIRNKIGIKNKKVNLKTYLSSIR